MTLDAELREIAGILEDGTVYLVSTPQMEAKKLRTIASSLQEYREWLEEMIRYWDCATEKMGSAENQRHYALARAASYAQALRKLGEVKGK